MKSPIPTPCTREFGWSCLALYFPRRCGGLSPWTMWREFRLQRATRAFLHRFNLRLTHSEHVRDEYIRHGCDPLGTRCIPFFVAQPNASSAANTRPVEPRRRREGVARLLFLGRFDVLKGGQLLLRALPEIRRKLGRPVILTLAGDGPARRDWEALAQRVLRELDGSVQVQFPGWLVGEARRQVIADVDLLVVPSLWPEPFGMTGLEMGALGVPAVAFDTGGVRTWLRPGVNGQLAPGSPPTASGLAEVVAATLADEAGYGRLSAGALAMFQEHSIDRHLDALEEQFDELLRRRKGRR
jgi:glycosyltransferase involved in cell wall biosynthesis